MGFWDNFSKRDQRNSEKEQGFAEREAARRDSRDAARRLAKVYRELTYVPAWYDEEGNKQATYVRENGVVVYRIEPDLFGYGIYDVQNGNRCVGSITDTSIRLEGGYDFTYAPYIPELGWFLEDPTMFLSIYDKNDRLIAESGPTNYPNRGKYTIRICKPRVDLCVVAIVILNEMFHRLANVRYSDI